MGVDDVHTRPRMASASAGELMPSMSIKTQLQVATEETESDLLDGGRRRTSIPPSFAYGSDEGLTPPGVEERRWRSFDWTSSMASAKTSISLGVLSLRIDHEHEEMRQCKARLRPRRRSALLHSVASFFSPAKKEQIHLRRMQMVADVAKRNRSLAILNDLRTMVLTMDDESVSSPASSTLTSSTCGDQTPRGSHSESSIQRLLDGMANADQVLAEDSLHHILELQSHWLERLVEMHADKTNNVSKERGTSSSVALQQFLAEFVGPDGVRRVPCTLDIPTVALVRFEKLLTRYRVLKPQVKESLDQLCRDTMKSFVRPGHEVADAAKIWQSREPRDVMQSLIRELFDSIIAEAWVAETYHSILRAFVEQMVFSRLAGACYRNVSEELDDKSTLWRSQVVMARALDLEGVGLPVEIPQEVMDRVDLFAKSVEAFNQIPHLVPSCVLGVFLGAIRVLYTEANELLGLECGCVSADVLLPLLVYVLSRCDLPHLHSQVFIMENYAIETSQEGSEAAYYLACLQAAIGYIMTEVGKKNDTEA